MAVYGMLSGVVEEILGISREKFGKSARIATCLKFQDFGHWERQTCGEPWVDTAPHIVTTFCAGGLLK